MEDIEETEFERIQEQQTPEVAPEECECVNYYPGFIADAGEEQLEEFERMFEEQFFMRC